MSVNRGDVSLTHHVAAALRSRIMHGELPAGVRLPSERALAERLKVSRVTVVRALSRLRNEGLVVTRHGSGTFVATTDRLLDTVAPTSVYPSHRGRPGPDRKEVLDLREATTAGPADLLQIADTALRTHLPTALRGDGTTSDTVGLLTELLADHLTATGLATRPDQLILTTGATSALELVVDALATASRHVIVETPTYPGALSVLARRRKTVLGWPAGSAGWDTDLLSRLLRSHPPGLLYVQPDGHNPTGATMPPTTRERVVRAASAAGWVIVADETMRPLRLSGQRLASLAAYDSRVITISSMSKTVWGGLRLGWIRASAPPGRRIRAAVPPTASPSALDQTVATGLLPSLNEIVERRCRILGENLRYLENRLAQLGDLGGLTWETPTAGITLWLDLGRRSSHDVAAACARLGVLLEPASTYAVNGRDDTHLRIPFTTAPPALDQLTETLARVINR